MKIDPQIKEGLKKYLKEKSIEHQESISISAAYNLSREEKILILSKMKMNSSKNNIEYKVDPSLIAGVVITVGSQIIDLSLKGQLQNLRNKLYESS